MLIDNVEKVQVYICTCTCVDTDICIDQTLEFTKVFSMSCPSHCIVLVPAILILVILLLIYYRLMGIIRAAEFVVFKTASTQCSGSCTSWTCTSKLGCGHNLMAVIMVLVGSPVLQSLPLPSFIHLKHSHIQYSKRGWFCITSQLSRNNLVARIRKKRRVKHQLRHTAATVLPSLLI